MTLVEKPLSAYRGSEPYTFVCYAHDDSDAVYAEIAWLQNQNINLWYDEGISAGRVWRQEIHDALAKAANVLFYVSEASINSSHCNREINFALDHDTPILPVYLEQVQLPGDLAIGLARVQALFRYQDPAYRQRLTDALTVDGETSLEVSNAPTTSYDRLRPPRYAVESISVRSSDPEVSFLAQTLGEQIVGGLNRNLFHATPAGAGINSEYTLSASLTNRRGDRIRFALQEFSTDGHHEVWSEHFDFDSLDELEDRQDKLVAFIADQSWHRILLFLRDARRDEPISKLSIWEIIARGYFDWIHDLESRDKILGIVRTAIELDPHSPFALCHYAFLLAWVAVQGFTRDFRADREAALTNAEKALSIAPNVPWVMDKVAYVHWGVGNLDYAIQLSSRVAEIVGNGSFTLYLSLLRAGRSEEAVKWLDTDMITLDGSRSMADNYMMVGRLDDAFAAAYRLQAFAPGSFLPWLVLANLHGLRGEISKGQEAWQQAKLLRADLTLSGLIAGNDRFFSGHPNVAKKMYEGLLALGVDD